MIAKIVSALIFRFVEKGVSFIRNWIFDWANDRQQRKEDEQEREDVKKEREAADTEEERRDSLDSAIDNL